MFMDAFDFWLSSILYLIVRNLNFDLTFTTNAFTRGTNSLRLPKYYKELTTLNANVNPT